MVSVKIRKFQRTIWDYYKKHGRDFAWRRTKDTYRILISEIMLQQTQTSRVELKYGQFLKRFPSFSALMKAKTADVLRAWQGLGYNRRALALKKTAEIVVKKYHGNLPKDIESLVALPGIGPATAGAVRAFAFNLPSIFIETNIRRTFIHFFFTQKRKASDQEILKLVTKSLPAARETREWYWALMDYGAMLGSPKRSESGLGHKIKNPNRKSKHYIKQSKFEGSNRQLRGRILRILLHEKISTKSLARQTGRPLGEVKKVIALLHREGFDV